MEIWLTAVSSPTSCRPIQLTVYGTRSYSRRFFVLIGFSRLVFFVNRLFGSVQ